jgi:cellobiose transport system permease protein
MSGLGNTSVTARNLAVHGFLALLALLIIIPFYWMIIASTRPTSDILRFPPYLTPGTDLGENFRQLFAALPAGRAFGNSLFIATTRTALVLFFCSLGGFGFAKYQFPGRDKLFLVLLGTMMMPSAISLVPWYIMMSKFGWVNDFRALIIPGVASAFGVFWMRQYIAGSVPDEMLDAARLDGCGHFRLYWQFVVPLIRPGLGTLAILAFLDSWNDFLQPLIILNDAEKFTLPVILGVLQNQYGTNVSIIMTGAALATLPVLAVFIVMSRQFISGISAGALKG